MSIRPSGAKGAYTGGGGGGSVTPAAVVAALYKAWDGGTVYPVNAFVAFNGIIYMSRQGGNTGHSPASSPSWWHKFGTSSDDTQAEAMKFYGDITEPWG